MNRQEIFDKVSVHFITQGECATATDTSRYTTCVYLNKDEKRCAIGCLIPDKHPGLNFTGSVSQLLVNHPDLTEIMDPDGHNYEFLRDLQKVHDMFQPYTWSNQLAKIAKQYNLDTTKLIEATIT